MFSKVWPPHTEFLTLPGASAFAASRQATVATTDYTVTGLTPGTEYTVRVIATRTNAADGAASDAATGTPKAAPPGQPGTATVTPGIGTLAVSWSAATNASGYKVQWRSGTQNYAATRQATATTTSHVVTGLAAGTEYTVRIIATRTNADDGMASVAASGTPLAAPPGQPANVMLMRGVGSLAVSWTAAANADGYKVQWKSGSESWSAGRQQTASGTNATIAGLAPGTTYSVRVIAFRANAADGVASVLESAQPKAAPPNQVATVTVTSGVNQLVVSWAAATNAAGYKVQWKSGSQAYGSARQTTLAATSHTITGLANGTTYSVRVIATRANADDSAPSPEVSGTPTPARPAAPAVVQAEIATGGITVQWSVVENADGYRVQWKSSTQNYSTTRQATVDAPTNKEDTTTSYTITGLIEKETYTVRVFATRTGAQDSPASSEATADAGVGGTPTSLLTITPGVGTLVLSWPDVKDATDYKVQWKSGSQNYDATRQTIVATTLGNTETHTITSLTGGTEYTVRVTPRINTVDQTSFEGAGTPRTTAPGRPTVTVAAGVGQLLVRWTGATNASGYQVQWKSGTQAYDVSRQATVTGSSYTITGLTPNTVYTVRVIATRALAAADTPSADRTGTPRAAPPGQVETVAVTPGIGSLALSWTPAADATGYKVQWIYGAQTFVDDALQILRPSTPTCQSTPPRCTVNYTIPSLTAGTAYRVRVIATRTNAADGAPSVPASGVPRAAAPGQPTGVTVTVEVGALAVSWTAAANADGYKVQWKTGGDAWSASRQQTASGTSATITGLAAGIEYTVRVIATRANAADGPASTTSTGAAQTTSALAPESITVTQGVEQLVVRWSAPTNTSGYKVQWKSGGQSYNTGDRQATATSTMHTITGLTGGTRYTTRVIATRLNAPDSAPSAEASGTPRAAAPGQPTNVSAGAEVGGLAVTWTAAANADGYKVQWKSGGQGYDAVARQATATGTSRRLAGLIPGTEYSVRVIATRAHAADGTPSSAATSTPMAVAAAQPSNVRVVAGVARLTVTWNAAADAGGYKVQWKSGSQVYDATRQGTTPGSVTSYAITGLTPGNSYRVQVLATRTNAADSAPSLERGGTPSAAAPGQPTGLTVTAAVNALAVSWQAAANADAYVVQWKSGGENYDTTREASTTATRHTIANLVAGTRYTVRVIARRAHAADSPASAERTRAPKASPPGTPGGVTVTPGARSLTVRWTAATNADGYKVQWKSGTLAYALSRQATPTDTAYTIMGLTPATAVTVRVIATRVGADDGPASTERTGTPLADAPGAPMNLTVTPGQGQLVASWDAVAGVSGYKVQWKSGDQTYDAAARQAAAIGTSIAILDLRGGVPHMLRVAATHDSSPDGAWSAEQTGTPKARPPGPPADLVVTAANGQLKVSWTAATNADGYKVQWKSGDQAYNAATRQSVATTTLYIIRNLTVGTTYTVRVIATRMHADDGEASAEQTGTPTTDTMPSFAALPTHLNPLRLKHNRAITAITLPAASSGDGHLAYTMSTPPAGVTYTAPALGAGHGGTLTGTPTATQNNVNYTLTATDDDGDATTLTIPIAVRATPAITSVRIRKNPGGTGPSTRGNYVTGEYMHITLTFDGDIFATDEGIRFKLKIGDTIRNARPRGGDQGNRRLLELSYRIQASDWDGDGVGVPRYPFSLFLENGQRGQLLKYPASEPIILDVDGYTALSFDNNGHYRVNDRQPSFGSATSTKRYVKGVATTGLVVTDAALPAATFPTPGAGETATDVNSPLRYRISPALPEGLTYNHPASDDSHAGTITGTPANASAATNYHLTATDIDGDATTLTFPIVVEEDTEPTFPAISAQNYPTFHAVSVTLPAASGGNPPLRYPSSLSLPAGLTYTPPAPGDNHGGTITGTPTVVHASANYALNVTDYDHDTTTFNIPIAVTPAPAQPSGLQVSPIANGLSLSWNAAMHATGYKVQWTSGALSYSASRQVAVAATSHTITGLTPGTSYTVRVIGTRANAPDSAPSAQRTGTPRTTRPAAPAGVVVTAAVRALAVSWNAVANANGYRVQWRSGTQAYDASRQTTVTGSSANITGLSGGTAYTVRVLATRANAQDSPPSAERTATPYDKEPVTLSISATGNLFVSPGNYEDGDRDAVRSGLQVDSGDQITVVVRVSDPLSGSSTDRAVGTIACSVAVTTTDDSIFSDLSAPTCGFQVSRQAVAARRHGIQRNPASDLTITYALSASSTSVATASGGTRVVVLGTPSVTVTVRGQDTAPSFGSASVSNKAFQTDSPITEFQIPTASGGNGTITYTASTLPIGLSFDADGSGPCPGTEPREICGTPTAPGNSTVTITASDADSNANASDQGTLSFDISVGNFGIAITSTTPAALTEANLNGAQLHLTATGTGFDSVAGLVLGNYALVTDIDDLTISAVTLPTNTTATLTLDFSGDIIADEAIAVTVKSAAHSLGDDRATDTTTVAATFGVTVSESALALEEDSGHADHSGSYSLVLQSQPTSTTTIFVTSDVTKVIVDTDSVAANNQRTLTFNATNWDTAQSVQATAAQDADGEDEAATLSHRIVSGTAPYDRDLVIDTVSVAVNDDEALGKPTGMTVTPGVETLTVAWTAATGSPTAYKVQWKSGPQAYDAVRQAIVSTTSHTIPNLLSSTTYTVRVIATRANYDDSEPSDAKTSRPMIAPPGRPTDVTVAEELYQLTVSWTAATNADGYKVQWKSGAQDFDATRQAVATSTSHTIVGLIGGTTYTVRVTATRANAADGPASANASGVPRADPPGRPSGVTVTEGVRQLTVRWTASANADGYKVQWKAAGQSYDPSRQATATTTSHVIAGLTAGTEYTVRVTATRTAADDSPASSEHTGTPKTDPPAAPADVTVTEGVRQLTVSWTAAANADGYKVQWKSAGQSYDPSRQATATTTSHVVAALAAGTEYTIRVFSTRANADDSPASAEHTGTPKTDPPAAPADVTVAEGVRQLAVSWTAAANADGYKVQWKSAGQSYDPSRQATATTTSHVVAALAAGTEYTIRVLHPRQRRRHGVVRAHRHAQDRPASRPRRRGRGRGRAPADRQLDRRRQRRRLQGAVEVRRAELRSLDAPGHRHHHQPRRRAADRRHAVHGARTRHPQQCGRHRFVRTHRHAQDRPAGDARRRDRDRGRAPARRQLDRRRQRRRLQGAVEVRRAELRPGTPGDRHHHQPRRRRTRRRHRVHDPRVLHPRLRRRQPRLRRTHRHAQDRPASRARRRDRGRGRAPADRQLDRRRRRLQGAVEVRRAELRPCTPGDRHHHQPRRRRTRRRHRVHDPRVLHPRLRRRQPRLRRTHRHAQDRPASRARRRDRDRGRAPARRQLDRRRQRRRLQGAVEVRRAELRSRDAPGHRHHHQPRRRRTRRRHRVHDPRVLHPRQRRRQPRLRRAHRHAQDRPASRARRRDRGRGRAPADRQLDRRRQRRRLQGAVEGRRAELRPVAPSDRHHRQPRRRRTRCRHRVHDPRVLHPRQRRRQPRLRRAHRHAQDRPASRARRRDRGRGRAPADRQLDRRRQRRRLQGAVEVRRAELRSLDAPGDRHHHQPRRRRTRRRHRVHDPRVLHPRLRRRHGVVRTHRHAQDRPAGDARRRDRDRGRAPARRQLDRRRQRRRLQGAVEGRRAELRPRDAPGDRHHHQPRRRRTRRRHRVHDPRVLHPRLRRRQPRLRRTHRHAQDRPASRARRRGRGRGRAPADRQLDRRRQRRRLQGAVEGRPTELQHLDAPDDRDHHQLRHHRPDRRHRIHDPRTLHPQQRRRCGIVGSDRYAQGCVARSSGQRTPYLRRRPSWP